MTFRLVRLFVLLIATLPIFCFAQSNIQLISTDAVLPLSAQLKIFNETDQVLTLEQIRNRTAEFNWPTADNSNYGYSDKGVWLYTTISNVTTENDWVLDINFSQLEKADMYVLFNDKIIAQSEQGKLGKDLNYRLPTLEVTLPYAQTVAIFIRLENKQSSILAPIILQTQAHHKTATFYDNILWGLFYGGLIMLAIYILILYITFRDNNLLGYVAYIFSVLLWQFIWGGHFVLMMPTYLSSWLGAHTDIIFTVIGITSGLFTLSLLDAEKTAPKSLPFIKYCIFTFSILAVSTILGILPPLWQSQLVYVASFIAMIIYTCAGFESYSNKFYSSRFYILGWCILATCGFFTFSKLFGVLPINIFTSHCFQVGLFVQVCLFSVALIDKSRYQLQLEVEQATKDLRNNIELVEEQNVRLDIARKDAIAASHVKSQFLANMSHEIRTPLNAILGFSKELHSENLPIEKQEHASIINAAADNLLNIVNDVLDFSKIEAGKLQINNHPFSPNQLLEDVVSVMAKSAHLKNLEFIYDLDPLPEKLIGDSYRIKQLLNNLLGNALKFTDYGHIRLSVSGKEKEHGIYELTLRIEDSGIGISREDKRKLFAAFSQVDDALNRSYQGTGLGLVICQELVKLMRGELSLQSTPGVGSVFTVTIRNNLLNTNLSIKPDGPWQGKQIIYFDPNPLSRYCGIKMLTSLGAVVTGVESLAFLKTIKGQHDTLFISVPWNKVSLLPNILEATRHVEAKSAVLLYSAAESLSSRTDLSQYFLHKIRLPLTLGKIDSLLQVPVKAPINALQQKLMSLPKVRVLAVDDMEMNLLLLTTWFKNTNLQLTLSYGGKDAVDQCQIHEFDLILMDVQMPNLDGLAATKLIRQTPLNLGTPIIAVTAHAFKEEQDRLLSSGMDDYLPKPINLSDLVDLIQRWCQVTDHVEENVKSFDWDLALVRSNQNELAAKDLLIKFMQQLPKLLLEIENTSLQKDFAELQAVIHLLHGACCYTGVPAIHKLCDKIETLLKNSKHSAALALIPNLLSEGRIILQIGKQKIQPQINLG
ncbi:7TM diverse intracellular signaling domain-containing protein [Paraglaciecola aquimarina]|uniref:histidine kinase n=1 Tax=Paraglaciecola aquimarina TaxID=1235557 RepID=A0ABU3SUK9_9ALTE|nr:7TM diverse intracellular signaling domain-containing protein [Paraglaciecola aquimarina]MDU0353681.1 7TM diverse intracellular signaling domain-containing protein [Paraglaciecola aquimarina]